MPSNQFVKIDSHAHITSDELFGQADQLIERAKVAGVNTIINIATCQKTLQRGLDLEKRYPGVIYNTAATTPHDVDEQGEAFFPLVKNAAENGEIVAIGETGLDYFKQHAKKETQIHFLRRYFALAANTGLHVVIHCRSEEAFEDLFAIAKEQTIPPHCLLHCFTGNLDQAKKALDLGWTISISGIVTFKKSESLVEVVKEIPLNRLVMETDSPYLAPQTKRGGINEPSYLGEIAECIAKIKEIPVEQVCRETVKNSFSFFQLSSRIARSG